jgi:hypothetical protein
VHACMGCMGASMCAWAHPLTKLTEGSLTIWNGTGLSFMQCLLIVSMALTSVLLDGLFSWKRSPPRSTASAPHLVASCSTSSKASKESSRRTSSFSQTP